MCMEALSPGHKQLDHPVFLMLHATKNGEQALMCAWRLCHLGISSSTMLCFSCYMRQRMVSRPWRLLFYCAQHEADHAVFLMLNAANVGFEKKQKGMALVVLLRPA